MYTVLIRSPYMAKHELDSSFWSKVDKSGDCWLWTGYRMPSGYGRHTINGKEYLTHRLALEWRIGSRIPPGLCACHRCDVPSCVNPDHLWVGTRRENMIDRTSKGRQAKGETSGASKLSTSAAYAIRAAAAKGGYGTQSALARQYGVSRQAVSQLLRGATWRHLSPLKKYLDTTPNL